MFEQTLITGRLAKDPEMRYTGGGKPMTTFSIPIDRGYTKEGGEKVDVTQWYSVSVFGNQAESCATYLKKGSIVAVIGLPSARGYLDRDGKPQASLNLTATQVRFILTENKSNGHVGEEPIKGIDNLDSLAEIPF